MENGQEVTAFIEECMELVLGICGVVNKLTALLAAARFHNPNSTAIQHIEERNKRCAEKTAQYEQIHIPNKQKKEVVYIIFVHDLHVIKFAQMG